jgi:HlyD family secretion protein
MMNFESRMASFQDSRPLDDVDAPNKSNNLWIALGAILLMIVVVTGGHFLTMSGSKGSGLVDPGAGKEAPRVTVVVPGKQLVENQITATGLLAARREMPVGAVGEGGLVTRVLVEPGSWVQQGQVLAVVDRQVQAQQSNQLAAQIAAAQANARLAQSELDRSQALVARGFISKADLDRKSASRDAAVAQVRVAQAQLAENRARIGRLDIRAPASGLVLTRAVEPGQVVGGGAGVLFRIAMGGEMELKADISEMDVARLRPGAGATVVPVGSTQEFRGQIWQMSPVIDPQRRQGEARIALGYNAALKPGGFATAKINSGMIEAPFLPESAVQSDKQGNFVLVIDGNNVASRRAVTVGSVSDKGVSILSGLNGNEQVVLSAGGFLNPGEKVSPVRAKTAN